VKVDNISTGWFTGITWKPTDQDTLGLNYHAKIKNKMTGKYNIRSDSYSYALMTQPNPFTGTGTLVGSAYPGLALYP
ncbi:outer membrane protein transport protein, partial [Salmonella enterica]